MQIQHPRCTNPTCQSYNVTHARVICDTDISVSSGSGYVQGHGNVYTHGTSKTQRAEAVTYDKPAAGRLELVITMSVFVLVLCLFVCVTMANVNTGCMFILVFPVIGIPYGLLRGAHYKRAQRNWEKNKLSHRYYCNNCSTVFQA